MNRTRNLWGHFAPQIGISGREIAASFRALEERYSLPRRCYHTLHGHIRQCVTLFHRTRHLASSPLAVEGALWTHDAYYDPRGHDNEERSGVWARSFFNRYGTQDMAFIDTIVRLIAVTAHTTEPNGNDETLVADIDLSILGASQMEFDLYESGIWSEYDWVPWPVFAERRASILKSFLERPVIYHHRMFFEEYERRARENLSRSIERLQRS